MTGTAVISDCGTYRYVLTRHISQVVRHVKPALFVMLNPSTASADVDDPTIRRCTAFATAWLCTSLTVVNLYALRATNPDELARHASPIGPENERHLTEQLEAHWNIGVIVAAWGSNQAAKHHSRAAILQTLSGRAVCLGMNKDRSPKHPLYIAAAQQPIRWSLVA